MIASTSLSAPNLSSAPAPGPPSWIGLFLVLTPLLVRASTGVVTLPGWDIDPTIFHANTPAIGPAGSMLIDAVVLLGAGVLALGEARARRGMHPAWLIAAACGATAVVLHGWFWQALGSLAANGTLGNQRLGSSWIAAIAAGIAVLHAARHDAVRRTIVAVLLGFIILLALRGLQQVYIEHPETLRTFDANRDKWLAAYGWLPDSPMAQAYIRRMRQPEATGWFALSNVYASFAGLGVAIAAAWCLRCSRPRSAPADVRITGPERLSAGGMLIAACAATVAADSKGGYVVAILGLLLVGAGAIATRSAGFRLRTLAGLLGSACIAGVLALVVLRGAVGERIGELSLLFRWFYMQAAARIIAEHAPFGVGPDGFQLAYLAAKNPLNPEEVTSPHSVMLDWLSTLGLGGAAWCMILVAASVPIGRVLLGAAPRPAEPATPSVDRAATRTALLSLSLATVVVSWFETPNITPDGAAVRGVGLALGCLVAVVVTRSDAHRWLDLGLAAGALAMLAHAQIELTGVNPSACALFMVALTAAAAGERGNAPVRRGPSPTAPPTSTTRTRVVAATVGAAAAAIGAVALTAGGVMPAYRWETDLRSAARAVQPIVEISDDFASLRADSPAVTRNATLQRLAELSGGPFEQTQAGVRAAFERLDARLIPEAVRLLLSARDRFPDEWRPAREAARLALRLAEAAARRGDVAAAEAARRTALGAFVPARRRAADQARAERNAPRLRAEALILESLGRQQPTTDGLADAISLLKRAAQFDPYNLEIALRLFKLTRELNLPDEPRLWAARCLELDRYARLDRGIRGLSSQERRELEAAAGAGALPTSAPPETGSPP